ncbi:MAG: N-acetyltransferase family protein [Pseudobdellovibrionaceae bacterium]
MKNKKFVHLDPAGNPWGTVSTEQLWANVYAIKYNRPENRINQNIWQGLFAQAKAAAIEFGAESIGSRIRLEYEPDLFRDVLTEIGFEKSAGRIEYQCDISNLPGEEGSPLTWRTAKDLNWDLQQIAQFTKEVTTGALDVDPNEKPEDFIQDWLHHHEFTAGPEFIAIGFSDNQPVALAVAQINSTSGWSRISYMGLIPSHREKGLGKWVHRHGFTMMKQQGGKLYHGGTHAANSAMRKLFESHGCHVFCEMEEWSFHPKAGQ